MRKAADVAQLIRERYEALETLGRGGEGRVVKALDSQHGRFVALKIRSVRAGGTREEMLNEARVLLAVPPHPALPLVREDFFDGDDYLVAMDWVDGTDLAALLRDRGRPGLAPSSVLAYLAEAASALTHLHSQVPPVIHGDVKPGNLILTRGGRVKLVDFGLSSAPSAPRRRAGTPGYRAPELAAAGAPSRASDVYALAATAFTLLTGSAPAGVLPSWDGIDPAQAEQLEDAIRRGMATDPSRRPATPGELVERLRAGWATTLPTGVTTFCLSDIEGSTAMWDSHPEAMAEALVRHDELIADCVERHGGQLIKSMGEGDSTVSVFASPTPALRAAVAATRALAAERWPDDLRIVARFGLHTGEAERRGTDYFGPSVNLAAGLRGQADGGQVFLSAITSDLVARHLPEGFALVDLGPHRLRGGAAPERIRALKGPGLDTPLPVTECPYRGLLAFEPEDREFFFGREQVVQELLGVLAPGRLLAVVGASGSGKSSVLRAGMVAAVRAGEVPGVRGARVLTPGASPRLDGGGAADELVVVDQFEELFTLCDEPPVREAFIEELLAHPGPVAIGVRADMYGRLSTHAELARAVAGNHLLLGAMADSELERAVSEPARLAGLRLEPGLTDLVLRDVAREPGALPLLSHALRATWERRDGRTLTVEGYRESGGVASALARTADRMLDSLPADRRGLTRNVFLRLTELGEGIEDTRRRTAIAELVPEGASLDAVHALLERLADARLVSLGADTAELAHETLIREWPTLRAWLDEDREGIRLHRQLGDAARLWDSGGRARSDLYRGARLAAVLEWAQDDRAEVNATERAFLDASRAEAERERREQRRTNRRLRGLLAGTAFMLVVAVLAGVVGFVQRGRARHARSTAEAQALRSDAERIGAEALTAPSLDRSLLLAVAGVDLQDRPETRGDLLAALQKSPAAIRLSRPARNEIVALAVAPGGRLLAAADSAGDVHLSDATTGRPRGATIHLRSPVAPRAMRFAPDGRTLAVATGHGARTELSVVDVVTRRARRIAAWRGLVPAPPAGSTALAYSPDGRRLAVGLATGSPSSFTPVAERLVLLDPVTGRSLWQRRYPMRPGQWEPQVEFIRGGRLLTSAQQGDTLLWDPGRGRIVRRFPIGGKPAPAADGRHVALALNSPSPATPSSSLAILDLRTGRHTTLASALPSAWVLSLGWARDGSHIVGGAFDGVHVWDPVSGAITETYVGQAGARAEATLDPAARTVYSGSEDGSVAAWDLSGTRRLGREFRWTTPDRSCPGWPCMVVDPRSRLMATDRADGSVALVDLKTLRPAGTLPARNGPVASGLAFLPDGRTLVTGGIAGRVTFWNTRRRAVVRTLRFRDPVWAVAVDPAGRRLAVQTQAEGSRDSRVEVRELPTGRTLQRHTVRYGHGGLEYSPDGHELVALGCCETGSTVAAWDGRTGGELFRRDIASHATAIELARRGHLVGVGTEDGSVLLLDARTGRQRGPALAAAGGSVYQIGFSPDGRSFAVGAFDQTARLWDLGTRTRVGDRFPGGTGGAIPGVVFAPDGRLLVGQLGNAAIWPGGARAWTRFACRVAGRQLTSVEWRKLLPNRPYRQVCR